MYEVYLLPRATETGRSSYVGQFFVSSDQYLHEVDRTLQLYLPE